MIQQHYRNSEFLDRTALPRTQSAKSAIYAAPYRKLSPEVRVIFVRRAYANSVEVEKPMNLQDLIRRSSLLTTTCKLCEINRTDDELDCLSDCGHRFCHECLRNYVMYKLNVMEDVTCPSENCPKKIDVASHCFVNLPDDFKRKYYRLQVWMQTIDNPNLKLCPAEHCSGIINTAVSYACQLCRVEYCAECMLRKHVGPCDTNFQHNFKDWKRCPACKMFIEKTQGCNHMTCNCHHQFCYVCLQNWEQSHYECGQRLFNPIIANEYMRGMSSCGRKMAALLMMLVFPIAFVLGVAGILIAMVIASAIGGLCGPFILASNSNNSGNAIAICCPLVMVACAIGGFFVTLYYGVVALIEQTKRYCNTISDFWSFQDDQAPNHLDFGGIEFLQ